MGWGQTLLFSALGMGDQGGGLALITSVWKQQEAYWQLETTMKKRLGILMSDKLEALCRITWGRTGNLLIRANLPIQSHPRGSKELKQSQEKGVSEDQVLWKEGKIRGKVGLCCREGCSAFSAMFVSWPHSHPWVFSCLSLPVIGTAVDSRSWAPSACCIQMFPRSLNLFF